MSISYVQNISSNNDSIHKSTINMLLDLETFKQNNFTENDIQHIFINMSMQSNSYINFMNNENKLVGKKIRLYFHKLDGIEKICDVFIENRIVFNKIVNIILYSEHDYYTKTRDVIDYYIKTNNIKNYIIYY